MVYLANAFSLNMLNSEEATLKIRKIDLEEVKKYEFISCIGHSGTVELLSKLLGKPIQMNRIQIKLNPKDRVIVFQLLSRLEEGRTLSEEELKTIPFIFYEVIVE